jgi:hypothetical protein
LRHYSLEAQIETHRATQAAARAVAEGNGTVALAEFDAEVWPGTHCSPRDATHF